MESPKRAYAPDVRVARTIAYSHVACKQKLYGNARDTRAAALSQLVRSSQQRYNQHRLDGIKLDFVEEVDLLNIACRCATD
jgi:hypothetical protein